MTASVVGLIIPKYLVGSAVIVLVNQLSRTDFPQQIQFRWFSGNDDATEWAVRPWLQKL